MQSRLPDINTAFNTHRKRVIIAIERRDWLEALGSLYSINASLEMEFRVIISNQKYREMTKQDIIVSCNNCKETTEYKNIKIINVQNTLFSDFITNEKTKKVWFCPSCNQSNDLLKTKMEQTILTKPYYLGVVTEPPDRTDGLLSHVGYDRTMKRWCLTMLAELEAKMADYRDANWDRGEQEEMMDVDTSLEEST